jgi:hypothetical protein
MCDTLNYINYIIEDVTHESITFSITTVTRSAIPFLTLRALSLDEDGRNSAAVQHVT